MDQSTFDPLKGTIFDPKPKGNTPPTPGTEPYTPPGTTAGDTDIPPVGANTVLRIDERLKEIEAFVTKAMTAAIQYQNGLYQSELWPSIRIHGETIFKSTIETSNSSKGIPAKGIIPTELSMTVDGISEVSIGEAFIIQKGILPSKYDTFGFIVVGVDQGIKGNRWYTTIRAQTFNIGTIDAAEITVSQERLSKFGFY